MLSLNLSLFAAQSHPTIKTDENFEIKTSQFITTKYVKNFTLNITSIEDIQESGIIMQFGTEKCILVPANLYLQNIQIIQDLMARYQPIRPTDEYKKIANLIQSQTENSEHLKTTVAQLNSFILNLFKNKSSYVTAFFLTYSIIDGGDVVISDKNTIEMSKEKFLCNSIYELIKLSIRKHLNTCMTSDCLIFQISYSDTLKPEDFYIKVINKLDDNYIIAFTLCEIRELLKYF